MATYLAKWPLQRTTLMCFLHSSMIYPAPFDTQLVDERWWLMYGTTPLLEPRLSLG